MAPAPVDIPETATLDEILATLHEQGLTTVAARIVELSRLHATDPDEPELNTASLRELARVLINYDHLQSPQLMLREDGCLHAEWPLPNQGRIAMTVLPTGYVEFGAISAGARSGKKMLRIGGLHTAKVAIAALRSFTQPVA